jgi:Flp pilus assembly protein CpaB
LWIAAGLLLALIAGAATFVFIAQMSVSNQPAPEPPKQQVLVAARDLPLRTVLAAGDLKLQEVPPEMVPEGAVTDVQEAVGMLTMVDMTRGEIILASRLIAPDYVGPKAAFVMDPARVIVAFAATDLLGSLDVVRPGDRVDLMFTFDFSAARPDIQSARNTLFVLQDVGVAAVIRGQGEGNQAGPPRAFLFALDPQDALTLKAFRDQGGAADLALRSPSAEGEWESVPVDGDYLLERYDIRWRVAQ